jgi:hypothetical protein
MYLSRLFQQSTNNNASSVTAGLLKKLQVPVTTTSIIDSLEQHPDYPSLLSISDSLKKWKVENIALQVENEKLEELPVPFIAHSKVNGGNLILVNAINVVWNT